MNRRCYSALPVPAKIENRYVSSDTNFRGSLAERHFADTRFVAVYRIDRRTANVWGEWSSYPADKGTASINYDATLQGKSPVRETSYIRLRSLPPTSFLLPLPPAPLPPPVPHSLVLALISTLGIRHSAHGRPLPETTLLSGLPAPGRAKGRRATEL